MGYKNVTRKVVDVCRYCVNDPLVLAGYIFVTRELDAEIIEAGLQMSYNLCNLPKQITTVNGKTVKYTYFADGTKFKAVDAIGNGFVYTGFLRLSVENGTLTPESMAITGGRAVCDSTNMWSANYYITDHLGSVRAVTDAEGEVLDTFDYMPYGSEISSTSSTTTDYRFTGKERQSMVNNSIYDSFARFQNTYGRFMSIDPKAESFYHISPYTYCAGDPVNLVDPDGKEFTEALEAEVSKLEKYIRKKIFKYQQKVEKMKANSPNYERYNGYIADLEQALNEYQVLCDSKQLYDLNTKLKRPAVGGDPDIEYSGWTGYNNGTFIIYIGHLGSDFNISLIHELKHAYQFETGYTDFDMTGNGGGAYYDIADEEEAHNRQTSLYGQQVGDVNGPAYEKLRNREKEGKTIKGQIQRPYNGKGIAHPKFR